jgi:hypothetical protein
VDFSRPLYGKKKARNQAEPLGGSLLETGDKVLEGIVAKPRSGRQS